MKEISGSIQSRLEKAERLLATAQRLLALGDYESSVSRAYYAVFHALIALLEAKRGVRRKRWDHVELLRVFAREFRTIGYLFSPRDETISYELQWERVEADYGLDPFSRRRAERQVKQAKELFRKVKRVIYNDKEV